MGLLAFFRRKALTASPGVIDSMNAGAWSPYPVIGGTNLDVRQVRNAFVQAQSASYALIYTSQPAVRTVIDYIARNVSQLGLKLYEREGDNERRSRGDHAAATTIRNPNPYTPAGQFIFQVTADWLVFDNAYVLKLRTSPGGPLQLLPIPPHMVGVIGGNRFSVDAYRIHRADGTFFDVKPDDMIHWRGYNPDDPRIGISRLETLRQVLAEEATSQATNIELLKNGLQSGHIERPLEAPNWSDPARQRFEEDWANRSKNRNRRNPVLEEGMKFVASRMSPKDAEMLEGRKFTLETVARIYGLATVPAEDEEARRQFYADVLPPITSSLEEVLGLGLLLGEYNETDLYFEFNLDEKLRGNIEEKLSTMVSVAGAPFMLRNEVRAMQNLPPVDGGDELITPLNVLIGDKPSVREMPPQDPNGPPQDGSFRRRALKAAEPDDLPQFHVGRRDELERQHRHIEECRRVVDRHFDRLERSLREKSDRHPDGRRRQKDWRTWDRQFAEDLQKTLRSIAKREGTVYAFKLGGDFDMAEVQNYLRAMAEGTAAGINAKVREEIAADGLDEALGRRDLHTHLAATSIGAHITRWTREESARQAPGTEGRVKTWIPNSKRHADFGGDTVRLDEPWPAGFAPGAAPGCQCSESIT